MSSRKDELLAKKARLAELKRQRELRQEQLTSNRQSIGGESSSLGRSAEDRRSEIDNLVSSLIDRRREPTASPSRRDSRPSPLHGASNLSPQGNGEPYPKTHMQSVSTQTNEGDPSASPTTQTTTLPPPSTLHPKKEYITYSKGVQTEIYEDNATDSQDTVDYGSFSRSRRRSSRRDLQIHDEIRANLKKEIEEELKAAQQGSESPIKNNLRQAQFPLRTLNDNELNAVTSSADFLSFVERSSKVIERALDDEYDLLADYTRASTLNDDDDDNPYSRNSKKSNSLREVLQLQSEKYTRRRMVADIQFSPHFNELLLSSYTKNASAPNEQPGLVMLWNTHAPSRPEYTFTAQSDVLAARFSPFHPNWVIGGCYSGQICLWDTRVASSGAPVRKTPQSGSHLGHTHPVYNISIIGTPNAHNILTASMDGVVCSWSFDMLSQAQEYIVLNTPPPAKTDDLAPTSMTFPSSDPTFFLVGTEEGSIYPCHRYDRAGARAGVDNRVAYRGHTAPVMSTQFHPARGPVDLSNLLLSSSTDWSLRLWRVRPAASTNAAVAVPSAISTSASLTGSTPSNTPQVVNPILDIGREDLVYDAKWAPHKPGVFACVTGAGEVEVFDLLYDTEVPIAKAAPTRGKNGILPFKGLNKLAWEEKRGSQLAVGGLDGVVTLFDVGRGLQCASGEASMDEWVNMKRLMARLETAKT